MAKYRAVFNAFVELCGAGEQKCSFHAFCKDNGVVSSHMPRILKGEYIHPDAIPGYSRLRAGRLYRHIYNSFKELCADGKQPGTFTGYCQSHGTTIGRVHSFLKRNNLRISGLPGFSGPCGNVGTETEQIPFENIIFEEAGFLPPCNGSVITVKVDGHMEVSFPSDTDLDVIAKFLTRIGKEKGHVES